MLNRKQDVLLGKSPKPFVKWAGGKRQLVNILIENAPATYNTFIEPFIGGGALLLNLAPKNAIIADINPELINAYRVISEDFERLSTSLQVHRNEEEYFYTVRTQAPSTMTEIERASRFIFLNKTCFNGLYRENSKGKFNVPFGRYKNPNIDDRDNLLAIASYLSNSNVRIFCQDFKTTADMANAGDFIYFDPPYHPTSQTASFTKYAKSDFTATDQEELADTFLQLSKKGCYVMLSNSNVAFINELYKEFNVVEIEASRFINCKADKRGKGMYDVLVKNY